MIRGIITIIMILSYCIISYAQESNNSKSHLEQIILTFDTTKKNSFTIDMALQSPDKVEVLILEKNDIIRLSEQSIIFSNLKVIRINYTNLDTFPVFIREYKTLVELDLSNNKIKSIPHWIVELEYLESINLENNRLDSINLSTFKLINLRKLDLNNNQISLIPSQIEGLKQLEILNLESNKLKKLPKQIKSLNNLKKLMLWYNFLGKNEIKKIKKLLPNTNVRIGEQN